MTRRRARRRLPGGVFDYIDGGAEDERTARRNVDAFDRIQLRPRVQPHRPDGPVDPACELLGRRLPVPLVLAPTGMSRMAHPRGELAVAEAAAATGVPYTLSTMSSCSIEDVAAVAPDGERWFQVYVWRDRGLTAALLERARAAGYRAIVITVDTPVMGRRERDVRRGFSLPPTLGPGTILDAARRPRWVWGLLQAGPLTFANVADAGVVVDEDPMALARFVATQFDAGLSWDDIEWFRARWSGPIIVKGIQHPADAVLAVDHGVDAIVLSNHGGRQLDDAPPTLELVAPVVDAVAGRADIMCDGGIRRGSDIVKARCLGAAACMIGRPYLWGLAADGAAGVARVIADLDHGVRAAMRAVGAATTDDLGPSLLTGARPGV